MEAKLFQEHEIVVGGFYLLSWPRRVVKVVRKEPRPIQRIQPDGTPFIMTQEVFVAAVTTPDEPVYDLEGNELVGEREIRFNRRNKKSIKKDSDSLDDTIWTEIWMSRSVPTPIIREGSVAKFDEANLRQEMFCSEVTGRDTTRDMSSPVTNRQLLGWQAAPLKNSMFGLPLDVPPVVAPIAQPVVAELAVPQVAVPPVKRGRGRPRKYPVVA